MKNKDKIKEEELRREAQLLEKSFEFWENQVNILFDRLEFVESQLKKNPHKTKYEKELTVLYTRLMYLIEKGDIEDQAIQKLQEKIDNEIENRFKTAAPKKKKVLDEKILLLRELGVLKKPENEEG